MFSDAYRAIVGTLTNPAEDTGYKIFIVIVLLLLAGFAWMVGKRLWRLLSTPLKWWQSRQAWRAMAAAAGWTTPATRKLAGSHEGLAWRLRVHVAGAWISDTDSNVTGNLPSQAQWRMRDIPLQGQLIVISRAEDERLTKQAEAAASGDASNTVLAAAGLAGLLLGQGWAGTALDMAGALAEAPAGTPALMKVEAGSDAFRQLYVVRCNPPELAQRFIHARTESMLLRLQEAEDPPHPFSLRFADGILTLGHLGHFESAQRAEALCRLGLAFAAGAEKDAG